MSISKICLCPKYCIAHPELRQNWQTFYTCEHNVEMIWELVLCCVAGAHGEHHPFAFQIPGIKFSNPLLTV